MLKATKQFLLVLALVATLCLVAILVAGISQLAGAASAYDARLGPIVAWSLMVAFLLLLLWPLVIFVRFPKPLVPPDDPALQPAYVTELKVRLARNPHLAGLPLETDEELSAALETLGRRADEVTEQAATRVFLGTALLQNGRLDALVVLAVQLDLVWKIAAIYNQRPSPRQMGYLYANVGATAFVASELAEADFAEMLEPIFVSVFAGVPGAVMLSSAVTDALVSGAANAFLTLRVGAVARLYSESTTTPVRSRIRRSAIASAAKHLKRIVTRNAAAVVRAATGTLRRTLKGSVSKATDALSRLKDRFTPDSDPSSA